MDEKNFKSSGNPFEDLMNIVFGGEMPEESQPYNFEYKRNVPNAHVNSAKNEKVIMPFMFNRMVPNAPRMDVMEKDGQVRMEVELAGFSKDEIELSVKDKILTIYAKREEKNDKDYVISERRTEYKRSVSLAKDYKPEDFSVTFNNGVLTITFPKDKEEEKDTRIKID